MKPLAEEVLESTGKIVEVSPQNERALKKLITDIINDAEEETPDPEVLAGQIGGIIVNGVVDSNYSHNGRKSFLDSLAERVRLGRHR